MPRRKKQDTSVALNKEGNEDTLNVQHAIQDYMAQYSASVIVERAIPNIDGLKPVQRRLLYTMWKMNLVNGKHTKLNNIGGQTMVLHPHGDPSPAVYTMGAEWLNNVPYAKIDGNGGTIVSGLSAAAATRYTAGSLTEPAEYLMHGLKENAVDMIPNYDQSTTEPVLLPVEYPNVLMNATSGIAVGMSTNIIPHNPQEIMDAIIYYVKHPKTTPEKLAEIIKGPDFPTGGLLVDSEKANLRELKYGKTGKINSKDKDATRYVIRGEAEIVDSKSEPQIKFTSIPYGITIEELIDSFNKFAEANPDLGMVDLHDNTTDYNNIDISIVFKRGTSHALMEQTLALLYQKTKIENTISPNNLIIANGHPQVVSITQYFKEWLAFREEFMRRQFKYELKKHNSRLNIVTGLLKLIGISDNVVRDARNSKGKTDFKQTLVKKYKFNEKQAEAIATIQLYRLGKQDFEQLTKEEKELDKEIARLTKLLEDKKAFTKEIIKELTYIRNHVFKDNVRRTKLVEETKVDNIAIDKTQLIKKQDVVVVAKRNGVVQRMSQQVYDNNLEKYDNRDMIVAAIKANTRQGALFFTKYGLSYYRSVNELINQNLRYDVTSAQQEISSYKADDETMAADTFDLNAKQHKYIVSVSAQGMVKVMDEVDVIPNTSTRAYYKRTKVYNGLKRKNDYIVWVKPFTKAELKKATLVISKAGGRKSTIEVPLKDMHLQGANGSGSRKVNVSVKDKITNVKIK